MPDFQTLLIYIIPLVFAITLHEAAHGWVASKLGDHTARMMGRVTLENQTHRPYRHYCYTTRSITFIFWFYLWMG